MAFVLRVFWSRCALHSVVNMPKGGGVGFYAVRRGKVPGVYKTWDECLSQTKGFSNARFKKFPTLAEAEEFIGGNDGPTPVPTKSAPAPPPPPKPQPNSYASSTHTAVPATTATYACAGLSASDITQLQNLSSKLTESVAIVGENLGDCNNLVRLLRVKSAESAGKTKETLQSFDDMLLKAQNQFQTLESLVGESHEFMKELNGHGIKRPADDLSSNVGAAKKPRKTKLISPEEATSVPVGGVGDVVEVYTDGCCHNNGQSNPCAGIGVYWGPQSPYNAAQRLKGRPTNNRAEIHAARKAIHQAKMQGFSKVKINTDSQFLIKCITQWIKKWKQNNWTLSTGKAVINRKDFEQLEKTMEGIEVIWNHVPAHVGIPGNEAADKLANEGARKPYLYKLKGAGTESDEDSDEEDWI